MYGLKWNDTDKEFRRIEVVWGMFLFERPRQGNFNDLPGEFAEELVRTFRVSSVQNVPDKAGAKLDDFNDDDETEDWSFRELVGSLTW